MIAQETISKVKAAANLIEVVGESVALRRQGRSFVGLCPFHSERSPSFMIRDSGESYYCFGCGQGGNVISYVMQTRGLTFPEAVEDLAARFGIAVVYERGSKKSVGTTTNTEELYKLNSEACRYFVDSLKTAPDVVKKYMLKRRLNPDVCKTFMIGFARDEWSSLVDSLSAKKINQELIIKSGLAQRNTSGRLLDRFRGRLIFPIFIDPKRIAGFGGRMIPDLGDPEREKKSPKYLNSPETEIYKKSKILYGLPQASQRIRETGEVYLVEGYLDVISFWSAGIKNSVATCGTAATEDHIKRLAQLAKRLIVVFDGDTAGRNAAAKMYSVTVNSGIDASAIFLDSQDDPDTLVEKYGTSSEEELLKLKRLPLFECYIESLIANYSGSDGATSVKSLGAAAKGKIAVEVAKQLSRVENTIERSSLIETAATKLMIEGDEFLRFVEQGPNKDKSILISPKVPDATVSTNEFSEDDFPLYSKLPRLDQELLRSVVVKRELLDIALSNPMICSMANQATIRFLIGLQEIVNSSAVNDINSVYAGKSSDLKIRLKDFLHSLKGDWLDFWRDSYKMAEHPGVNFLQMFQDCLAMYEKTELKERLRVIEQELGQSQNEEIKVELGQEMLMVRRRLSDIRDHGN